MDEEVRVVWMRRVLELMKEVAAVGGDPYDVLRQCAMLGYSAEDLLPIATSYELSISLSEAQIESEAKRLIAGVEDYLSQV